MDPIDVVSTLVTGAELVSKVKISKFRYCWNRLFKSKVKVIVYGDSGVGKTQFLNTITGRNAYTPQRTRRPQKLEMTLSTGRVVEFCDTPGHQSSYQLRSSSLDDLTRQKIKGIINIVNYGYQDADDLQMDPSRAFNVDTGEVKDSFLRANRQLEIKRTKEILSRVNPNVKPDWIITLVNKADVWYSQRNDVYKYYMDGEYGEMINRLEYSVKLFVVPFCSVITPFANREMRLIFSERDKKQMFDVFIDHLESLILD